MSQMASSNTSNNSNNNNLPSPTLTNPDMILPFEDERETSTPSPPFDAVRRLERDINQSGFQHPSSQYFSQQQYNYNGDYGYGTATTGSISSDGIGVAVSQGHEQHSSASHSRWYDNHNAAPPLSDIGEESEEDEDYRKSYRMSVDTIRGHDEIAQLGSSNDSDTQLCEKGDSESCDNESCSGSSDTTVGATRESHNPWPPRSGERDSSGNHTPTAGTDEGRDSGLGMRSENGSDYVERSSLDSDRNRMSAIVEEDEGGSDDDIKAAERILENAKKRLTHMEDNLTRARSSMRMTPSPAPSSGSSPTPYQPFGSFSRGLSKGERRAQTSLAGALLRQRAWQEMNSSRPFHTRRSSDMYVPSFQSTRQPPESRGPLRSASALASTNASGFGASDTSSGDGDFAHQAPNRTSGPLYSYAPSSPARTDNLSRTQSPSTHERSSDIVASENVRHAPKMLSMDDFNAVYPASPPSQLQVRDLHDQMQDLKCKISNLKVKAQEDGERRRSLQSLRTPSPFTATEQWYAGAAEHGNGSLKRDSLVLQNQWDSQRQDVRIENSQSEGTPGTTPSSPVLGRPDEQRDDACSNSPNASSTAETEDEFEDALGPEDRAALDEILNEPLDSPDYLDQDLLGEFPPVPPIPEALRHEDRIDAFDYEHFYLHSVLGNYSGGRRDSCGSSDSTDSVYSVETARAGSSRDVYSTPAGSKSHRRTNSGDSISTSATFATATEGQYSSEDEGCTVQEIDQALGFTGNSVTSSSDLPFRQQYPDRRNGTLHSRQTHTRQHMLVSNGQAYADSPTYPGFSPGSNSSTPRASPTRPDANHSNVQVPLTPAHLISSLISFSSPSAPPAPVTSRLQKQDAARLESLLQKLGQVCSDLVRGPSSPSSENQQAPAIDQKTLIRLRRRLETATRVLNGELDV